MVKVATHETICIKIDNLRIGHSDIKNIGLNLKYKWLFLKIQKHY